VNWTQQAGNRLVDNAPLTQTVKTENNESVAADFPPSTLSPHR